MYHIFASFIVIIFPMSDIVYFLKIRLKSKYLLKNNTSLFLSVHYCKDVFPSNLY